MIFTNVDRKISIQNFKDDLSLQIGSDAICENVSNFVINFLSNIKELFNLTFQGMFYERSKLNDDSKRQPKSQDPPFQLDQEQLKYSVKKKIALGIMVLAGMAITGAFYNYAGNALIDASIPSIGDVIEAQAAQSPKENSICVFTSFEYPKDKKDRMKLSRMVAKSHKSYCDKYGYYYHSVERNLAEPSLPYWSKIKGTLELLDKKNIQNKNLCNWIVWVDDDMVFTNSQVKLEDVINYYKTESSNIIVAQDSIPSIAPLNTGIIITKNSQIAKKIMKAVWDRRNDRIFGSDYTYSNCPNQSCFHEQEVLTNYYQELSQEKKRYITIVPQRDLNRNINTFSRESHLDLDRNMFLVRHEKRI